MISSRGGLDSRLVLLLLLPSPRRKFPLLFLIELAVGEIKPWTLLIIADVNIRSNIQRRPFCPSDDDDRWDDIRQQNTYWYTIPTQQQQHLWLFFFLSKREKISVSPCLFPWSLSLDLSLCSLSLVIFVYVDNEKRETNDEEMPTKTDEKMQVADLFGSVLCGMFFFPPSVSLMSAKDFGVWYTDIYMAPW